MTLTFIESEKKDLTPRITVFGVGGAGGNAVNNMIEKNLEGVEFVVANTDAQALQSTRARSRIQLGVKVTEGLGAGARPAVGATAAEEALEEIVDHLAGAHMCFITAGMGGGTGTGAAPIIAQAARELGVLTVGVVTKPFAFEGSKRMRQAEEGVEALQQNVDTLIIIPNQNLFRLANERTTFTEAFAMADDVLYQGVKGVTDLMVRPGMINLDFADVRAVMDEMGKAMMGTGEASGEDRARQAAEKAIANPLLDEISLNGARGVLINITGGSDLTLYELDEAANLIRDKVDPEANIIVGSTLDEAMDGMLRVSVVATGIEAQADAQTLDVTRRRLAEPLALHNAIIEEEPEPEMMMDSTPAESYDYDRHVMHEPAPQQPVFRAEPRQDARYEATGEQRYDARPESRYETQYEQPAAEYRPEPAREQAHEPAPQPQFRAAPRPSQQQPAAGHAPVQDEFDLDEVLGEESQAHPRPTVVVSNRAPAAHQPQQPHHQQPAHAPQYDEAASYTAPRPQPAGQPTPETMARLRQAVMKEPRSGGEQAPAQQRYADPAPSHHASHHAEPSAAHHAERSRFGGLGSLINRMAGSGHEQSGAQGRTAPPVQSHTPAAPPSYDDQAQHRASQERIEIPAFLRRQAN